MTSHDEALTIHDVAQAAIADAPDTIHALAAVAGNDELGPLEAVEAAKQIGEINGEPVSDAVLHGVAVNAVRSQFRLTSDNRRSRNLSRHLTAHIDRLRAARDAEQNTTD